MTKTQLDCIEIIEEALGIKFSGRTSEEADEFIKSHLADAQEELVDIYSSVKMSAY